MFLAPIICSTSKSSSASDDRSNHLDRSVQKLCLLFAVLNNSCFYIFVDRPKIIEI